MIERLFTIIAEFRGTTDVSQVRASNERDAMLAWLAHLRNARPFGRASTYLAKSLLVAAEWREPVALRGLANVWCFTGSCGKDFMIADIVATDAGVTANAPAR